MVIIIYTLCVVVLYALTKSYRFFDTYYSTVLFVICSAALYQAICRGHLLWRMNDWYFFTSKLSILTQFAVLFPCTIVLFLRYLPEKTWYRILHFLGFWGAYVIVECFLILRGEITYQHGWNFWWSVFINFCMFVLAWIHSRSWKLALQISACVIAFLMVWFRIPLTG